MSIKAKSKATIVYGDGKKSQPLPFTLVLLSALFVQYGVPNRAPLTKQKHSKKKIYPNKNFWMVFMQNKIYHFIKNI
jgi:hypothetical protein